MVLVTIVLTRTCSLLATAVFLACSPSSLEAYPVFSRQTGAKCSLCHVRNMHSLTKYGRKFLMHGYRETPEMKRFREKEGQSLKNHDPEASDGFGGSLFHSVK
jgi:hypothetical protein